MAKGMKANPAQTALGFIEGLVKSNESLISTIDNSPSLKKKYNTDSITMEQLLASQRGVQEVMAMLFEQEMVGVREDDKFKWVDPRDGRIPQHYLRRAGETEIPRVIKNLRRLQLTEFSETASSKKYGREMGFALTWKNPTYKATKEEKERLAHYETKLQAMLFFPPGELTPSLSKFLGTMYEDFFDLDDITIRVRRDGTNYPIGLHIEDPMLWVPTMPKILSYPRHDQDLLDDIGEEDGAQVQETVYHYLMIKNDVRLAKATMDNIIKSHFFTRSDFYQWRRGYPIMEQAIRITTIIMNAITFNASNFSNNRVPAGFISLAGGYANPLLVEKLKKVLWAQMSGVANQRKIPIVGLPEGGEAKWVNIHNSNKEMEFYTGMTLFSSILFAFSGTNPNESGLASFQDALKGNRLNDDSKDGTYKQSRDNGLNTFLNFAEQTFNVPMSDGRNVMEEITGMPVKATFQGIASEDITTKNTINKERIQISESINDIRREEDLPPAKYMMGEVNIYDLPAFSNPVVGAMISKDVALKKQQEMQEKQLKAQQEAQAGQGEQAPAPEGEITDKDRNLLAKYGKGDQHGDQPQAGEEQTEEEEQPEQVK